MRDPVDHELGLFRSTPVRAQPRDKSGRFVRVRYSAHRLKVLAVAREMRERLGLPPSPYLLPYGVEAETTPIVNQLTHEDAHV